MQFTPPLFPKFGSSADDLLKKKLEADSKHEVIVKSQSKNISFTSTINTEAGQLDKLNGKLQIKYEDKAWGEGTVDLATNGKLQNDFKFTKLAPNTTITTRVESQASDLAKTTLPQVAVQYKQDAFAGQAEFIGKKKELLLSAAVGYEGFSVGGLAKADLNKAQENGLGSAIAVDGGIQYEDRSMTGTFTVESSNTIALSLFHALNKQTQFAAKLLATTSKGNSIAFGGQHVLAADTMVKGKIHLCDDKSWAVGTHFEQKVVSPDLTIGVTAFYDSKKSAPAFGISAQFGAY